MLFGEPAAAAPSSSVVKAKNFDPAMLHFERAQWILGGNYVIGVRYNRQRMQLQLPRVTVQRAPYEEGAKFYIDVITPESSTLVEFMRSFGRAVREHAAVNTAIGMHMAQWEDHMQRVNSSRTGDVFCSFRLKLPRKGHQFQVRVSDDTGRCTRPVTDIGTGSVVLCLANIENIYFINGTLGVYLNCSEIRIMRG